MLVLASPGFHGSHVPWLLHGTRCPPWAPSRSSLPAPPRAPYCNCSFTHHFLCVRQTVSSVRAGLLLPFSPLQADVLKNVWWVDKGMTSPGAFSAVGEDCSPQSCHSSRAPRESLAPFLPQGIWLKFWEWGGGFRLDVWETPSSHFCKKLTSKSESRHFGPYLWAVRGFPLYLMVLFQGLTHQSQYVEMESVVLKSDGGSWKPVPSLWANRFTSINLSSIICEVGPIQAHLT